MSKVEKAVEKAMKILKENGVRYVLACQTEDDCTISSVDCTPSDLLSSLRNIIEVLRDDAAKEGFPRILVAKDILDITEEVFMNDEIEGED